MTRFSTQSFFSLSIITLYSFAYIMPIDNHHFYRASNFFYIFNETRLTRPGLTSFDVTVGYGKTHHTRINFFNQQNKSLKRKKQFSLTEANFFYTQNLTRGFFLQAHCPIRHMLLTTSDNHDQKDCHSCDQTGVGDTSLLAGWTFSYIKTELIDFIDVTCSAGILIPTGKKRQINTPCAIPLGYNGHVGLPISYNCALGALEWITIGMHVGALFFFDTHNTIHLNNELMNNELKTITPHPCITTRTHEGTLWDITIYFKADHVIGGFSWIFGYTFAQQQSNRTHSSSACSIQKILTTKNSCSPQNGWNMHTLHFIAEYDFTPNNPTFGPRIGIFYNKQCGGKHIFKTNMKGGNCGLEISLRF